MNTGLCTLTCFVLAAMTATAQDRGKDSMERERLRVRAGIDSIQELMSGCTDFEPGECPRWVHGAGTARCYYKKCWRSGASIVLCADSTYLYKYNGEGGTNFLQGGTWTAGVDSILILRANKQSTLRFRSKMRTFEKTEYLIDERTHRRFRIKNGKLVAALTWQNLKKFLRQSPPAISPT